MFLPDFDVLCDLLLDTWNLFVLYDKEINFVRIKAALFFVRRAKVGPSPFWQKRRNPFDAIHDLYIGCYAFAKSCDWFRQITSLSNFFPSRGIKTYSEGRLELRNLLFLKKMQEKSSQFLSSDQPSEPKSLDVALNIVGVEKYARKTCDCGQPGGHPICVLNGKER